jgi:hypothetical protein
MGIRVLAIAALLSCACWTAVAQQDNTASNSAASSEESPVPQESAGPARAEATDTAPDLTPDANGKLSQEQMQKLLRVVADKDIANEKRLRDYTYIERDVQNNLDGKGQSKSTEIKTFEILDIYGEQVQRLIEKDDKPLDAKETASEEAKIQKIIDKRKNESEDDLRKRQERVEKQREESRKFVHDIADAYDFKLAGTEVVGGREAWVIDGEPRPGFEPQVKESKFLSKFRGRVWIDKGDLQLSRMYVEAIDTVSLGWVLARVHKGTRFMLEQTRVNDEVWLPRHVTFKFDARIALLKGYNVDGDQTFRDYRKFRTTSKIVGMGEIHDPPPAATPAP